MAIDYSNWANDPNIAVEIGKEIEKGYWKESKLEPLMGKGADRAVRIFDVSSTSPFRPRLKDKFRGTGVKGNTDFENNLDELEIFSQTIYPEVIGNASKSEIRHYTTAKMIDFIKETQDALTHWFSEVTLKTTIATLVNDFTNVVVADKTTGVKANPAGNKSIAAYCAECSKGDVLKVATIKRAIRMAKDGIKFNDDPTFPIAPTRMTTITEGGIILKSEVYILLVSSTQAEQLKADPEWKEMQKLGVRGDVNRVFTGFIGIIDNCVVVDMGEWNKYSIGMPNSNFDESVFSSYVANASKSVPVGDYTGKSGNVTSIGALIGASAICYATNNSVTFYIGSADLGRKDLVGGDKVLGISKSRYTSNNTKSDSPYTGQDFGVIGIISSEK